MELQGIFGFGAVAHGILAIAYFLTKFVWTKPHTVFYLLGHAIIIAVMLLRLDTSFIGSLPATVVGISGHASLTAFAMLYITKIAPFFNQTPLHQILNAGFIVGQLGMIINYIRDYLYGEANRPLDYMSLVTFTILAIFYAFKTVDTYKEGNLGLTLGMALVGILYVLLEVSGIQSLPMTNEQTASK